MPTSDDFKAQGNKAFVEKRYQEAIDLYSKAIALDKENAVLYSNRAQCHLNLRDWIRASNDVEVGLRLNPAEKIKVKLLYRKGLTAKGSGNVVMAKRAFNEALEMDPGNQAAASELDQLEPKKAKPETVDEGPKKVPVEVVDELPEEFKQKISGEPVRTVPQTTSANVDAIANELFGNRKETKKETKKDSSPGKPVSFGELPTMHYLKSLSSLSPERKHKGYKVVLELDNFQLDEMFSYSGLDSDFFEFFLEASSYFLKQKTDISVQHIINKLEYMRNFKRYDLVISLTSSSLINDVVDAAKSYGNDLVDPVHALPAESKYFRSSESSQQVWE
ncbi:hypothetical protein CXQ85_001221 [Candidozyma haemuli]|uniref:RNA-polymerase II-associated protein 3-like C-terminal domain-containing protein n=1 Tax=Candidozyma haemuli TaxID=45357 RepID=A0A2V1AM06_9ASCO|nr:hypothetical protein CXQ85_001221 [[Candida] haemuloni]PVH18929.1 hypothetical protein CXQ85_001221 [[Candida] haemuloni]